MALKYPNGNKFQDRHIGPNENELNEMLATIGVDSLDTLIDQTIPANIRSPKPLNLQIPHALTEFE